MSTQFIHDSFLFARGVSKFNSKNLKADLDVESLFTKIPLEKTIDNITNDLFLTNDKGHNLREKNLNNFLLLQHMNSFLFLMENITLKVMVFV